jgi:hypothetical protein
MVVVWSLDDGGLEPVWHSFVGRSECRAAPHASMLGCAATFSIAPLRHCTTAPHPVAPRATHHRFTDRSSLRHHRVIIASSLRHHRVIIALSAAATLRYSGGVMMELESYKVVADYKTKEKGEISIEADMVVEVIEKNDNGWWFVQVDDGSAKGWVPATSVSNLCGLFKNPLGICFLF